MFDLSCPHITNENKNLKEMLLLSEIKRGDKITYEREIMFKGSEMVTATIVAIAFNRVLLDNGDTLYAF